MEDTRSGARRNSKGEKTRRLLVEAAVAQLAEMGMRGLTHRLVEERAGLAQGSVKHHFGTLDGLIEATLQHMVSVDLPLVLRPEPEDDAVALAARAQALMETVFARPDLTRARFELYVHAAGRPELQAVIGEARDRFVQAIARSLPGPNALVGARFVAAAMDGLLLDQLSAPHPALAEHAGAMVVQAGLAGRALAGPAADEPVGEAAVDDGV